MMGFAVLVAVATAAPRQITFEHAVKDALERNPSMTSARADADRANAQVEQARAPSLPTLGANASYTHLDADRVLNGRILSPQDQFSANAQLAVPLFAPNRWANWIRASANAESTKASSVDVRRQVALNVARTWLSVLAQNQVVKAQERGVEVAEAHLTYARNRAAGGVGSRLDVTRAAQEWSVAKTQLANAQATQARLWEQLGVAVGVDEGLDALEEEPTLPALPDPEAALADSQEVRTDVLAAQQRVKAAKTGTAFDWTDYTPVLLALGQPGYQAPPTPTAPRWNFQAQVVLSLPLYDGGLRYGQQKVRRAALVQAQAQLENTARQAGAEVRASIQQLQRADEALKAAREAEQEAASALALAEAVFKAGGVTNLEVIDAERRERDAQTAVALAENTARQARLELLAASGRFPQM